MWTYEKKGNIINGHLKLRLLWQLIYYYSIHIYIIQYHRPFLSETLCWRMQVMRERISLSCFQFFTSSSSSFFSCMKKKFSTSTQPPQSRKTIQSFERSDRSWERMYDALIPVTIPLTWFSWVSRMIMMVMYCWFVFILNPLVRCLYDFLFIIFIF